MDITEKSFEYATDSSKLLTTLATGIIAFTVTFSKEFGEKPSSRAQGILLLFSWVLLLLSAVLGVLTLLAITGEIDPPDRRLDHVPSIRAPKIKFQLQWQIITFVAGVLLIVIYGAVKINAISTSTPGKPPTQTTTPEPSPVAVSTPSPTPVSVGIPKPTGATPISTPTPRPRPRSRPCSDPKAQAPRRARTRSPR